MGAVVRGPGGRGLVLAVGFLLGALALVAVHLTLRGTYWDFSEGVYALSAHQLLHGGALYTGFAGAQPPGVFLAGAGILVVHDGLEWLRFGVACLQLAAGLLAAELVLRVTGSAVAAALTVPLMLLTPWAVHEHGALTPELVSLPLLLGAALASAGEGPPAVVGVLSGLLVLVKVPFAIPAVVLIALSAEPWRAARWAVLTAVVGLGVTTALAGEDFWRQTVVAQTQTGSRSLGQLKGFWAQAGWNLLGLVIASAIALRLRRLARDGPALRVLFGLAAAMIITFLTNFKVGTGLNVTVPVEAALVPLAVAGTALAVTRRRILRGRARRAWVAPAICAAAWAFTLAQSASLVASPHHAQPFLRAGSAPAWFELMSASQFRQAVAAARACPPGVPYSGPPLIAFAAGRSMPAEQPDDFIIGHSRTLVSLRARVDAASRRCP